MLFRKRLKPDDPEKRDRLREQIEQEGGPEKHDFLAMVLSALLILVPVAVGVLLLVWLLAALPVLLH